MRDIELEEGEAYLFQDDYDDGENIDPDRDFSYIVSFKYIAKVVLLL